MTTRTSRNTGWRRAVTGVVASGAVAAGLMVGVGAVPALAEPTTEAASPDDSAQPTMTPDQALAIIAAKYDIGAGGGKVSTLIHDVMLLRQQGFLPSAANGQALVDALNKGPSQAALISALDATRSFQMRNKQRAQQVQAQMPTNMGITNTAPGQHASNLPIAQQPLG
jgi:hypothetical protein